MTLTLWHLNCCFAYCCGCCLAYYRPICVNRGVLISNPLPKHLFGLNASWQFQIETRLLDAEWSCARAVCCDTGGPRSAKHIENQVTGVRMFWKSRLPNL